MIFRRKLRYVLVESTSALNLADKAVEHSLKAGIRAFMGEATYFRSNPRVAAQLSDNVFAISCNRGCERSVILALAFTKDIGPIRTGLFTIKTSGTMRSLKSHFEKLYEKGESA